MKPFLKIASAFAALVFLMASRVAAAQELTLALPAMSILFSPVYVADEKGFWKSRGLDVKIPMIAGPGAINALMSGSAQVTSASPASIYLANARGQRLQAIASTSDRIPSELVLRSDVVKRLNVAPTDGLVARVQALKGLSLGVDSINGFSHGILRYMASESGMDPEKDLTVAPMQPASMTPALQARRIDGFMFTPPWPAVGIKQADAVLWIRPADELHKIHPYASNVILVRSGWCEQNQATCEKFVAGIKEALAFIHDQPQAAYEIVRKRAGAQVDQEVMSHAWNSTRPMFARAPTIDVKAMKNVEDFSVAAGLLKDSERVADWNAVINNRYAQ